MLPGGTDQAYRDLLATNARMKTRVEVWREGERIDTYGDEGVPVFSGQISATLVSQVARQLNMTTDETLFPADPGDLLAPYGNELRVFQALEGGAGVPYEYQTFRGRINTVEWTEDDSLTVECIDRGGDVNDAQFLAPENSTVDAPVTTEFRRLIIAGVPNATFGTFDTFETLTPQLTWEWDRGSACDDLAEASRAFWYTLANGDYVIRRIPWTVEQVPLLTLMDGEGGVLTSTSTAISREYVFNTVTVVGERADGETPVSATAYDLNVSSPTYVNGPFGRKSKLVRAQAAINPAQALSVARASLQQAQAMTRVWQVSLPADPSIELGDCFSIVARGLGPDTQVVATYVIPMTSEQPMTMSLRAVNPYRVQIEVE